MEVSSDNGTTFNREGEWLSGRTPTLPPCTPPRGFLSLSEKIMSACHIFSAVHTGKLDAKFKATLVNSTKWQYYGTPGYSGSLEMEWDPPQVTAARVNVELWGYAETGESAFSSNMEILKRKSQFSKFLAICWLMVLRITYLALC